MTYWPTEILVENLSENQRYVWHLLFGSEPKSRANIKDLVMAIFVRKNPHYLQEIRELWQLIFDDIGWYLSNTDNVDNFRFEIMIADLLAYYSFFQPTDYVRIPIFKDKWSMETYAIQPLILTPTWLLDPAIAYGLSNNSSRPILIFKGTTYPTDDGFLISLLADLNPYKSVGTLIMNMGSNVIQEWLEIQTQKSRIIGKSLGGILACLTTLNYYKYVQDVYAFSPPGFSKHDCQRLYQIIDYLPEINIFCQEHDIIPYFDSTITSGINYYQISGSDKGLLAHANIYSIRKETYITKYMIDKPNLRTRLTLLRGLAGTIIYPIICGLYGVHKLHNLIK